MELDLEGVAVEKVASAAMEVLEVKVQVALLVFFYGIMVSTEL